MGNKAMNVHIVVCWVMILCSLAGVCHSEIIRNFHRVENEGNVFF